MRTTQLLSGRLELVENLGEYALVHLITASGVEFIAKTIKPPTSKKGENHWLHDSTRACPLF
ncbi:hypothetical protein A9Q96_00445 [Rhodobacterales bacterium 52_120_T64]|nr:hypothetical protein A9Q96_00445 [Rhodobacterales bacterium 52_120_T64]